MEAGRFGLTRADRKRVAEAIAAAERETSGEIVVRIVPSAKGPPREHAVREFRRLGMGKTRHRTGVLLYLALRQRAIEILADSGIHAKAPEGFWDGIVGRLSKAFKEGYYADGLCRAVTEAGELLARHFPPRPDDANELPDKPVIGP